MTKKQRVSYWVMTALFLLPMAGSGIPELLVGGPASTAATIVHLGYPLYLMRSWASPRSWGPWRL